MEQTEAKLKINQLIESVRRDDGLIGIGKYDEEALEDLLLEAMQWAVEVVIPEERHSKCVVDSEDAHGNQKYHYENERQVKGFNDCRDHIISTRKEIGL